MKDRRKRHIIRSGLVLVLAVLAGAQFGCLDEIELPAPEGVEDAIVIQGSVARGNPSTVEVVITRLFDFTGSSISPVNVRLVELTDDTGVTVEIPAVSQGVYRLEIPIGSPIMDIEFGKSYQLLVETRDGRVYRTNFETLNPVPEAEGLEYRVVQVEVEDEDGNLIPRDRLQVTVNTTTDLPGGQDRARLKWNAMRTRRLTDTPVDATVDSKVCYLTDEILGSTVRIFDGNDRTVGDVNDFVLIQAPITTDYSEGAYINVFQQSLSESAYEYWDEIRLLLERTGNMFEPPAGEVATNFVNVDDPLEKVFGYFYCFAEDTARVFIDPELVGNPMRSCPPPGGLLTEDGRCAVPVCCDCLTHPNSTTEKPEYWTE